MDLLLRPNVVIDVMQKHDSSGIIERFVHLGDRGDLYDCQPHINISDSNNDVYIYPVRFGYMRQDIKELKPNMVARTLVILVTEDSVELSINFTPNHYEEFIKKLNKHYKKIQKKCLTFEDIGVETPEHIEMFYGTLREYRFHAKKMRNYFWNNGLNFYFDKDKIIQQ